ncbi:ParB/RepB/Spo0J family partition protein [Pseudomonas sp. Irchel 3E13]|uniref:ParB/RepB/Spo0J family partition protein n=1 Tax=Pseudomonas sp. Irchel 3E13 TaxID=2008975 RepID=UPI000BA3AC24|nr:ParB/RepB/Spo0J family partition protein [Pseudomonas sp. Irchel 3E13]
MTGAIAPSKPTRKTSTKNPEARVKRPSLTDQLTGSLSANLTLHRQNIEEASVVEAESWIARPIDVSLIDPNPYQPRKVFDGIDELAQLIDEQGLINPIEVRPAADNRYQLVSGECRLRAHKKLGKTRIMAHVVNITDRESSQRAIGENKGRTDLTDYENAWGMIRHRRLFGSTSTTHEEFSMTSSTYYRFMAFENLPEAVNTLLDKKPALITAATAERTVRIINEKVNAGHPKESLEKALITILQAGMSKGAPIRNLAKLLEKKFATAKSSSESKQIKYGETTLGQSKLTKKFYEVKLVRAELSDEQIRKIEEFLVSLKSA